MVYIFKRDDQVYLKEDYQKLKDTDQMLYNIYSWNDIEAARKLFRPWKILDKEGDWYIEDVLEEVLRYKDKPQQYTRNLEDITREQAYQQVKDCIGVVYTLFKLNPRLGSSENIFIDSYIDKIKYTCDVKNYITYAYSATISNLVEEFNNLDSDQKEFLKVLASSSSRERKLEYLMTEGIKLDLESMFKFIPTWCFGSLKIFGKCNSKIDCIINVPEFRDARRLDGKPADDSELEKCLKNQIYTEFKLGEVTRGSELKARLGKIYKNLDMKRTPKVSDLLEYFNIMKSRKEYEWFYRIDTRRILK